LVDRSIALHFLNYDHIIFLLLYFAILYYIYLYTDMKCPATRNGNLQKGSPLNIFPLLAQL